MQSKLFQYTYVKKILKIVKKKSWIYWEVIFGFFRDGFVDKKELHAWILRSFKSLSKEESEERFDDSDEDGDAFVSWLEYRRVEFDFDDDEDLESVKG